MLPAVNQRYMALRRVRIELTTLGLWDLRATNCAIAALAIAGICDNSLRRARTCNAHQAAIGVVSVTFVVPLCCVRVALMSPLVCQVLPLCCLCAVASRTLLQPSRKDATPAPKWTHWDLNPGPSACGADVIPLDNARCVDSFRRVLVIFVGWVSTVWGTSS